MIEQKENQIAATGHDFGNAQFKLIGVHILEMYNPLKKFLQQAGNAGKNADKDKDNQKKNDNKKKEPVLSAAEQIEK